MSATKSAPMALSIVMVEVSSAVWLRVTFWVGGVGAGAVIVGGLVGGAERDLLARLDCWEVSFRVRSAPEVWDVDEVLLDVGETAVVMDSGDLAGSWMQSANSEG